MIYTFRVYGKDGKWHYPQKVLGPGLTDFKWTRKIENAMTWKTQDAANTIATEFINSELIAVLDGLTKIYHILNPLHKKEIK